MRAHSEKKTTAVTPEFKWAKLLLLFIPTVFTLLFSLIVKMPVTDAMNVTFWQLALMIFGLAALPLTFYFFSKFSNGGYFFSKTMGILIVALFVWTLTYMRIYRFSLIFIMIALMALAAFCYAYKPLREAFISKISEKGVMRDMLIEETIFCFLLVLLCLFKGMYPDINGQEKFMDYGFMLSMLRSDTLPANDMWLSGEHINYYYFGQYIYTLITKLIAIKPSYAYTLSMCTAIALPFSSAFCIGRMLFDLSKSSNFQAPKWASYVLGALTGLAAIIFGNSHSFFYDSKSVGHSFAEWLGTKGVTVGDLETEFFYPDSTRFIGHNPELIEYDEITGAVINDGDYTIHEFPFYSYLVGDLHAHVISMMVVLLIMAFCIAIVMKVTHPTPKERMIMSAFRIPGTDSEGNSYGFFNLANFSKDSILYEFRMTFNAETIAIGILLGIATMTNYWDFLIYFIFSAMALLVFNTLRSKSFITPTSALFFVIDLGMILGLYLKFSDQVLLHAVLQTVALVIAFAFTLASPSALTRTSLAMNIFFALSNIVAITFNLNFDMISNKIALCKNHTALYQFIILWGVHLFICIAFIIFTIINKNITAVRKKARVKTEIFDTPVDGYTNVFAKFFGERNKADVFVCGMSITGIMMLIAPEIIYVRDIYTGGYLRANTMFKFTFAGFIILSIAMAYAVVRLYWYLNKEGSLSFPAFGMGIFCTVLLLLPAHYTYLSLEQRSGDLSPDNFKTLDGTQYIETYKSPDTPEEYEGNLKYVDECIDWFNENVKGDPIICEAYGNSYTDHDIISAYTGLPTIFGWQTHEWLWRYHGIVDEEEDILVPDPDHNVFDIYINPRHADIDTVYTDTDPANVDAVFNKYGVQYVIYGPIEAADYGYDNRDVFAQLGQLVFESGDVSVYKVN